MFVLFGLAFTKDPEGLKIFVRVVPFSGLLFGHRFQIETKQLLPLFRRPVGKFVVTKSVGFVLFAFDEVIRLLPLVETHFELRKGLVVFSFSGLIP